MDGFAALGDPTRRRIVDLLAVQDRASGDIAAHFEISAAAVSQHLKILRSARLVRVRTDRQRRIYSLDPDGLAQIEDWVGRTRRFWEQSLDRLEAALHEDSQPPEKEKEP